MTKVSITEASKLVGKSRRTIHNYISQGKLSKVLDEQGNPKIDTTELIRVFGEINHSKNSHNKKTENLQVDIDKFQLISHQKDIELAILKKEVQLLHELLEEKEKRNEDLKKSLLLLEIKKPEKTNLPKKKWWKIFT